MLTREAVARARQAFLNALSIEPNFAAAHIGLANALLLQYESTRADAAPDRAALDEARYHALKGCDLDPLSADAWSALGMIQQRCGQMREALAAARKAVALDQDEWRHWLRLAYVSWGSERIGAVNRVRSLCPGLALAYWFAATVFVARGAYDAAIECLRAGIRVLDAQAGETTRFAAVGLHWLLGLVLAARGDIDGALAEFRRELDAEIPGHIYARECAANTWYAIGVLLLRQGRNTEACAAFQEAQARVPGHPLSRIGLAAASGHLDLLDMALRARAADAPQKNDAPDSVERAMVYAAGLAVQGKEAEAVQLCADALTNAPSSSSTGWLLPVEPLLQASRRPDAWARPLALLRDRAF